MIRLLPILFLAVFFIGCGQPSYNNSENDIKAKNVIILIADGQSTDVITYSRWINGGESLAIDEMLSGAVRTHNADSPIADSAPTGTALATGYKSSYKQFIGLLPDEAILPNSSIPTEARSPIANVLEAAQLLDKATGVVATAEIMHATPAAFSAHDITRKDYDDLSEQQIFQNIDVILGGGYKFFTKEGRKDGKDLISEITNLGYSIIRTSDELNSFTGDKVVGLFADADLAYDIDRNETSQPSLAQMTSKAIEILSKNKNGFFLMVEASKVDWAAHANDPVGLVSDTLAYDAAVKAALDFAKKDNNTMVIAVTDHGNSGFSMGNYETSSDYQQVQLASLIDPIKKASRSAEYIARKIEAGEDIRETMSKYYSINDMTAAEVNSLTGKTGDDLHYAIGPILAKRAYLGFTSHGHTGEDVPLYTYLPNNKRITGLIDNTDIAKNIAKAMGINLDEASKKLFMSEDEIKKAGAELTSDGQILTIRMKDKTAQMMKNRNIITVDGEKKTLAGVVVYNESKWYFPAEVLDILNK